MQGVFKLLLLFFMTFFINADAKEKKLVIIITSFNNAQWYRANLDSVFDQEYKNYRVIYVDDCSDDGTAELVEKYIAQRGQQHRCMLIKNKKRVRALANLYNAVHLCDDDEIVFNFDGDDWFAHNKVFALINEIYDDPNVWITYGQFKNWPTEQIGYCKPLPDEVVQKQLYRQKWWAPGQLRTFYAWLFKKVQLKDLFFEGPYFRGQFFPANSDLAIYYPMMEMAGHRHKFISDVIYIRNVQTPINDFKANKDVQVMGSALIRAKKRYPLLTSHYQPIKKDNEKKADVVIISSCEEKTDRLLKSIESLMIGINRVYILSNEAGFSYEDCKNKVSCPIIVQEYRTIQELNEIVSDASDYLLLLNDSLLVIRYINLVECIEWLEKTYAYGFYLMQDKKSTLSPFTGNFQPVPILNKVHSTIYAWAFHYADCGDWRNPLQWGCLYKKSDLIQAINSLLFVAGNSDKPSELIDLENIGLCYKKPKLCFIAS